MDWLGASIGAIGDITSGIIGSHASAKANKAQIAFQRELAQNKYQYAVEDMEKAGLNPKLAGTQAAGIGSSGAGSSIDPGDNLTRGFGAASDKIANAIVTISTARKNNAEAKNAEEQAKTQASARENLASQAALNRVNADVQDAVRMVKLAEWQSKIAEGANAKSYWESVARRAREEATRAFWAAEAERARAQGLEFENTAKGQESELRKNMPWLTGAEVLGSAAAKYGGVFDDLVGSYIKSLLNSKKGGKKWDVKAPFDK